MTAATAGKLKGVNKGERVDANITRRSIRLVLWSLIRNIWLLILASRCRAESSGLHAMRERFLKRHHVAVGKQVQRSWTLQHADSPRVVGGAADGPKLVRGAYSQAGQGVRRLV